MPRDAAHNHPPTLIDKTKSALHGRTPFSLRSAFIPPPARLPSFGGFPVATHTSCCLGAPGTAAVVVPPPTYRHPPHGPTILLSAFVLADCEQVESAHPSKEEAEGADGDGESKVPGEGRPSVLPAPILEPVMPARTRLQEAGAEVAMYYSQIEGQV